MVSAIVDHLQNVSIVNYDADNLHVRCLVHVLNLAVQSAFSTINVHQPKAIKVGPSTSASESDVDSAGEEDGNGSEVDLFLDEEEEKAKARTSSNVSSGSMLSGSPSGSAPSPNIHGSIEKLRSLIRCIQMYNIFS